MSRYLTRISMLRKLDQGVIYPPTPNLPFHQQPGHHTLPLKMQAPPEMKRFAESLITLSNASIGLMKATDQRIIATRQVVEDLNAVIVRKDQSAARQCQVISALAKKNAHLEKELKRTRQELRAAKGESPLHSDSDTSGSERESSEALEDMKKSDELRESTNGVNLPSLKEILQKLETSYDEAHFTQYTQRKSTDSPLSPPYSAINAPFPAQNPLKRRQDQVSTVVSLSPRQKYQKVA